MIYYCRIYPDDGYFSVNFPEVPGALTYGKTHGQALRMAQDALNQVLAAMVDDGEQLPKSKEYKRSDFYPVEVSPSIVAAAHIREARKAAGLTQKEMAARLSIAYQVYQRLEDPEKSNPTVKTLTRLANVLGHTFKMAI